jgi:hypothetical protein
MGIVCCGLEKFGKLKTNFFHFINMGHWICSGLLHVFVVFSDRLNFYFVVPILLNKSIEFLLHLSLSFFLLILDPNIPFEFPVIFPFF